MCRNLKFVHMTYFFSTDPKSQIWGGRSLLDQQIWTQSLLGFAYLSYKLCEFILCTLSLSKAGSIVLSKIPLYQIYFWLLRCTICDRNGSNDICDRHYLWLLWNFRNSSWIEFTIMTGVVDFISGCYDTAYHMICRFKCAEVPYVRKSSWET